MPHALNRPIFVDELELARRAAQRDVKAIREIMKIHNQRLYRLARAVLRSSGEAEDALQEAYLHAFASIDRFRGESTLATWLSRITLNEALGRLRKRGSAERAVSALRNEKDGQVIPFPGSHIGETPERAMAQRQILDLVELAMDELPEAFRLVLMARVVEGLSVEETAALLALPAATVKTRLHRARKLLRDKVEARVGPVLLDAFPFAGRRCDRLSAVVLERLGFDTDGET